MENTEGSKRMNKIDDRLQFLHYQIDEDWQHVIVIDVVRPVIINNA